MSHSHATPLRRRQSTANINGTVRGNAAAHDDLSQSLRQLSLSHGPSPNRSPPNRSPPNRSPLSRTFTATSTISTTSERPSSRALSISPGVRSSSVHRSSSVASNRGGAGPGPRSPLLSNNGRESRAGPATPTLLRKASLNSLHSPGNRSSVKTPLRRASSANLRSPSSPTAAMAMSLSQKRLSGGSLFEPLLEEPTAESIAETHFRVELARHASGNVDDGSAETVVILQDNCYGHRFSRPRTSRANLNTIVERPERLQAAVVGVSAAYVRLGGRHMDGPYMPEPKRNAATIPTVPFRIHKTTRQVLLQSAAVTNVHGAKWMEELQAMCEGAEARLALNGKELQRPASAGKDGETPGKLHEGDLYLCAESLEALQGALGGVCEAVDSVFATEPGSPRRAFVGIRPPGHHCSATWPSGFCWVNNVHVGIMHGMLTHGLTHVAIVDFDLHHGDGSQSLAWKHNARGQAATQHHHRGGSVSGGGAAAAAAGAWKKSSIGYFSLHDINSFPCEYGDEEKVKNASLCIEGAHGQTIWNVHLEPWKSEAAFWELYESKYVLLLDKVRTFLRAQTAQRTQQHETTASAPPPRGAIFISAGFDASEWETSSMQRHAVNVPTEFYARFTRDIVQLANEADMGVDGRVISVLEGGYSDRALLSGVLAHVSSLASAGPTPMHTEAHEHGLGYEISQKMESVSEDGSDGLRSPSGPGYDPSWWSAAELNRLEGLFAPTPPPAAPTSHARTAHPAASYSSPTQSSQAKIVASARMRRSMSGIRPTASPTVSRPPTPPPPEVPWTVSAHELSKLLIPVDRETASCTAEELSAEASRARRDRQVELSGGNPRRAAASAPATPAVPTRVSQRERKPVKPYTGMVNEEEERKNRRTTVGPVEKGRRKQPARRLSSASTAVSEAGMHDMYTMSTSSSGSTRPTSAQSAMYPAPATETSPKAANASLGIRKTRPATAMGVSSTTKEKTSVRASSRPPAKSSQAKTAEADMDKLANGMRRIKINVVTAAQKKEREEAKKAAEMAAVAAKVATKKQPVKTSAVSRSPPPAYSPSTPVLRLTVASQTSESANTDDSPVLTPNSATETAAPSVFVPYKPEGKTPVALPAPHALQWLPPNEMTVPTPMQPADLPVFTATSTIPFSGSPKRRSRA